MFNEQEEENDYQEMVRQWHADHDWHENLRASLAINRNGYATACFAVVAIAIALGIAIAYCT